MRDHIPPIPPPPVVDQPEQMPERQGPVDRRRQHVDLITRRRHL